MKFDYNKKYKQNNFKKEEDNKKVNNKLEEGEQLTITEVIEEPKDDKDDKVFVNEESSNDETISNSLEKYGTVVNCDLLNVRREPNANSNILTVINADQKIKILDELDEFYRVLIDDPINSYEGYCMKKFIKIN